MRSSVSPAEARVNGGRDRPVNPPAVVADPALAPLTGRGCAPAGRGGIITAVGRLSLRFAVAVALLGSSGCGPPPKDPAVVAFEGLFAAMARGDAERVHALLGPASRRALAEGVGLAADAEGEAVAERLAVRPGWTFIVDRSHRARLDPARGTADRRVVIGSLAGRLQAVPVVRVGESWRVELIEARPEPEAGS